VAEPLLIGLDVGTTSSKAVVFDTSGQALATGRAPTPWTDAPTGAEVDAGQLLESAANAVRAALARSPEGPVLGIGVASMAETGVLLSSAGHPVGPMIAWHDTRDEDEVRALVADVGHRRFAETTGLPLRHQWSLTKHRWLGRHAPGTNDAVTRLNVAEWVVRGFGGEPACELSLASRTGWLDLRSRDWWDEGLAWSGAKRSLLPPLVEAGTPLGRVSPDVGIPRLHGAVLTVAGHDHQAAAIGAGAEGEGDELDSCGTAEALVRTVAPGQPMATVATLAAAGVTVGWHAMPGRWCLLGATTGGLTLQGVLSRLGIGPDGLPALDEQALSNGDSERPGAVWREALETVTAEAADIHDLMSEVTGPHRRLVVTGGWSNSQALLDVKRRRLGPLSVSRVPEAGARGAALLGGMAAGVYASPGDFPSVTTVR
jgi:sugar (pentulose or hexulose) kinase